MGKLPGEEMNTIEIKFYRNTAILEHKRGGELKKSEIFPIGSSKPRRLLEKLSKLIGDIWYEEIPVRGEGTD